MARFDARRLSCPVHGTIGLSDIELQVLNTKVFQRLRNVKQLGLAHHVFPGADYSRFAHSLGVCHTTGRLISALHARHPNVVSEEDIQLYRLAALLHDVGHYPFSHAMEHAIQDFYSNALFANGGGEPKKFYKHERVSRAVVDHCPELSKVLNDHDPKRVTAIFMREEPPPFSNLVSSDLDADRIDYLLRTAHHTGLPYGSVDLDYIISQMRVDNNNRVCLTHKAVRAADHLLLSRYFDYQQVAFHKTVASLERVLQDVLILLLRSGRLSMAAVDVEALITGEKWAAFDDAAVVAHMREALADGATDEIEKRKIRALLERKPPKLLYSREYIGGRGEPDKGNFRLLRKLVAEKQSGWAAKWGIDHRLWYVWPLPGMFLTKIGSSVPLTSVVGAAEEDEEAFEQAILIQLPNGDTKPIQLLPHSLMHALSNSAFYALRIYAFLPDDPQDTLRKTISAEIAAALD